ncbi:MAG: hypothetical protein JWR85_494 [Marmoricola sp.]|nr:hypothetical protein [Marmoricola sp.]
MRRSLLTTLRIRRTWLRGLTVGLTVALAGVAQATPASAADRIDVEVINSFTGLRADVMWASTAPFQGVFLWPNNASQSQEFDLLDSGNGWFRIRARHSGQCLMLDWRGGTYVNGTRVLQYPYCGAGYAPAEWRVRTLSGTRCSGNICTTGQNQTLLVNRATNRCLDAASGGRPPVQAVLQQWDCVTTTSAWNIANQAWDLLRPGEVRID